MTPMSPMKPAASAASATSAVRWASGALERGRAALDEGVEPLLLVLRREEQDDGFLLASEAGGEVAAEALVDGGLCASDGQGGLGGDGARDAEDVVLQLGCGDDAVEEADAQGLVRGHGAAGEDEVLGAADADAARQALRAAETRVDAEADLGQAELGLVGGIQQ